ncbi:MAG: hypothetical protein H7Z42_05275 [Roseiflexaceae bacterium]|nr:hypothetical protein [Roseiflexaceae bacterium]
MRDLRGFAQGLAAYQLLPTCLVAPVSWLLPLGELALAGVLLFGVALPFAGAAAVVLLRFTRATVGACLLAQVRHKKRSTPWPSSVCPPTSPY